jgi:GT2 family glycosyltransferase
MFNNLANNLSVELKCTRFNFFNVTQYIPMIAFRNHHIFEYKENVGAYASTAIYRREVLEKVGFFDEDFFAYY